MAGLEGTIKTPMGPVQKKTALYVGAVVVVLGGVVYYRHKNSTTSTVNSTATDAQIDPATGYPYGSPEDAAALQDQANYVSPTPPASGGGSSTVPPTGTGYISNGAWTQGVIEYLTSTGSVSDPTALSAALGKYITGAYIAPGSNDDTLVMQAIAAQGYPPVTGPNGMPPALNRNPPQGGSTPTHVSAPTGLHVTSTAKTALTLAWNAVPGARGYKASVNNQGHGTTYYPGITLTNLKANTTYKITVSAVGQGSDESANAVLTAKTAK